MTPAGSASAAQFTFAAFGDLPYNGGEDFIFGSMMAAIDAEPLALTVHVGDFKSPQMPCSDELFTQRLEEFSRSKHPLVSHAHVDPLSTDVVRAFDITEHHHLGLLQAFEDWVHASPQAELALAQHCEQGEAS